MSTSYNPQTIAIIGAGKIGEAMIEAMIDARFFKPEQILVSARRSKRIEQLEEAYGVRGVSNKEAAAQADVSVIAVKPQLAGQVLPELAPALGPDKLLISVMAGTTLKQLSDWSGRNCPVIRAMPNTPLRIRKGMTALCGSALAEEHHLGFSQAMFNTAGRTQIMDEKLFDAVTGLSASGPAFIYIMIEALAEGGVKSGIPRNLATELAAQACLGSASMVLETGKHPAMLKDEVTTPAGCTIDGILKLEEGGIRVTLIKAVEEAARRAKELG
ncbi:pyrroline-5-carboxylate reductase [Cyclonatronum proteinivorum]|nr:pyrroline-5-carboxylate reductase [Cyclonatronum proteinivorum]